MGAAQHVDWLCQPVRGDDAQPGARVEEEQEVNDLGWHGEVAQDEVDCAMRGGLEGFADVKGEDVVGPPPLELPLQYDQGGAVLEPRRAPPCQSLTTPCRVSTSVMRWVRGPVSSLMSSWPRAMGR